MHIATNHRPYYYLRYYIRQRHYYYKGINNDISNVFKNCNICKLKANIKIKNEPTKQILSIILDKGMSVI